MAPDIYSTGPCADTENYIIEAFTELDFVIDVVIALDTTQIVQLMQHLTRFLEKLDETN